MKSLDPLLSKPYCHKTYHCVHFVVDAARYLYDKDYSKYFLSLSKPVTVSLRKSHLDYDFTSVNRLSTPKDGCVVLMTTALNSAHVGLFCDGSVLHSTESGVYYQSLRTLQRNYWDFKFYETNDI